MSEINNHKQDEEIHLSLVSLFSYHVENILTQRNTHPEIAGYDIIPLVEHKKLLS